MDQSLASSEEHQDIQRGGSETAEQPASAPGEAHTRGTAGAAALEAVPAQHDLDPEAAAGVEGIHARATETSDSQIERTKRDLRMLDHLDPLVAQRLIAQDPTALDRLPTTTKIMKAIAMLTNASDDFYETNPRGHPGSNPGLPLAVYSNIVQLLASALIDVGDHNSIPPSSPHKTSPLELAYARSKLGLDPSAPMQLDTTHLPSLDTGALPSMQAPMPRPVPEVSLIFAENARLALAVLRPRALFPLDLDLSQSPVFSSKSPISDGCRPVPSQVSSLPSEIILLIFHFAHSAAAQADPGTLSDSRYRLTDYDDTPAESLTGSIAAAQRFALSLARVCKRWVIPARTNALRHVHLCTAWQLAKFLKVVQSSPSLQRALPVVRIVSAIVESDSASNASYSETPSEIWSRVIELCPNVNEIHLRMLNGSRSRSMYLRGNFHTAYLDEAVLDTLSTTSNLTTLALEFRLDFEELEIIVNGLPHLESLSIRAIDNKSGSTTTTSAQPHPADRISSLRLGYEAQTDRSSPSDYSAISDVQLAWLLEPAVAHGNLHCLNLSIMPDFDRRFQAGAPAGAVGAAGLANANAPPFASATIANLLVRCGASLECLMMQDIERTDQNHPGFASAPHSTPVLSSAPSIQDTDELSNLAHDDGKDSNFDYALLHLVNLRQLSLQFVYTGPDLLESLAHMQHLQHLELVGIPVHTPSATFAEYLETTFEALETLTLSGYLTGTRGDQAGWTGAGLRRVKQIARQRGLVATFV